MLAQTRLLVTNSVAYLQQMDTIVVLKNGRISEMGTFQELLGHNAAFAEFVLSYLNDPDTNDDIDPDCKCDIDPWRTADMVAVAYQCLV